MPPITTTSGLPPGVDVTLGRRMLAIETYNHIYNIGAERDQMPKHGGQIRRRRRYNRLAPALVPLGNTGASIPGQVLSAVNIDAKIEFYATYVEINEQVTLQAQEPVLNQAVELLGVSLRDSEDTLTRDMLAAAAGIMFCTGGVNGDSPTDVDRTDIDIASRALKSANAKTILTYIGGRDRFATGPVRDSYLALCDVDLEPDLERVEGFIQKRQYPEPDQVLPSEFGTIGNFRFFTTSNGIKFENASAKNATTYVMTMFGLEAYSYIEQDGYSAQLIYRDPRFSDAVAQNATLAYKFGAATSILNDQWLLNLYATLQV